MPVTIVSPGSSVLAVDNQTIERCRKINIFTEATIKSAVGEFEGKACAIEIF